MPSSLHHIRVQDADLDLDVLNLSLAQNEAVTKCKMFKRYLSRRLLKKVASLERNDENMSPNKRVKVRKAPRTRRWRCDNAMADANSGVKVVQDGYRWLISVEPKVRLQGYGFNPFCSHSSRCLAVLV